MWAVIEREAGYTLDRSPVYHRATQRQTGQTTPHMLTLTPRDNLETVGGRRNTWREPTHTRGEHANSTQKGPSWESNLEPSCCEVTVLTNTIHYLQKFPLNCG